MHRDIKEIVGVLMRITAGDEVSVDEVVDLGFEADGDLSDALNAAYVKLLEFSHDRALRAKDPALDRHMRAGLIDALDRLVVLTDR